MTTTLVFPQLADVYAVLSPWADALLRMSPKDRMELYAKAVQNGIKTRNECRKLENDEPMDGADVLTAQVNLVPLDMLGQTTRQTNDPQESIAQ